MLKTIIFLAEAGLAAYLTQYIPLPAAIRPFAPLIAGVDAFLFRVGGWWPVVAVYLLFAGLFTGNPLMALLGPVTSLVVTSLAEKTEKMHVTILGAVGMLAEVSILLWASVLAARKTWEFVEPISGWWGALIVLDPAAKIAFAALIALLFVATLLALETTVFPLTDSVRSEAEARAFMAKHNPRKKGILRQVWDIVIYLLPLVVMAVFAWMLGQA